MMMMIIIIIIMQTCWCIFFNLNKFLKQTAYLCIFSYAVAVHCCNNDVPALFGGILHVYEQLIKHAYRLRIDLPISAGTQTQSAVRIYKYFYWLCRLNRIAKEPLKAGKRPSNR